MAQAKKVALITGANRGIGFETAKQLGESGVTVVLGSRKLSDAEGAAAKLKSQGIEAYAIQLDVTKPADRSAAVKYIDQHFGKLDILVTSPENNIANGAPKNITSKTPDEELRNVFETTLFSVVRVTEQFLPLLKKSDAGRIVNLSSILGSLSLHADPNSPIADFKNFS
ncbi:MAG TPA: SDR family NAD(P)-dependent oxidoreductase, partial [Bryocella sp.]|nr:SDR family NAD(P)-dependent oxidoreductase [Bryocella sp.]